MKLLVKMRNRLGRFFGRSWQWPVLVAQTSGSAAGLRDDPSLIPNAVEELERYPEIDLAVQPAWGRNPFFRGFDHLELNTRPISSGSVSAAT